MGKTPCCDKQGMKKGPWTPEEDELLVNFINKNGHGKWRSFPKLAGLLRCGKSCRLRWTNYLRPNIKRGPFTPEEENLVIQLHGIIGNKWAAIAAQLPGRTDNEIKNLWNTHLKKRLLSQGLDPTTHEPMSTSYGLTVKAPSSPSTRHRTQWESARLEAEVRLSKESEVFHNPKPTRKLDSDHFLLLWNSKVGESFRKVTKRIKTECHSPVSQASCTTKCGSISGIKTEVDQNSKDFACKSDSSNSNYLEDSSDTALQLFFDFPVDNDMNFLSDPIEEYKDFSFL